MREAWVAVLALGCAFCKANPESSRPAPVASSVLSATAAKPSPSAPIAREVGTWRGTYKSSPASLYIPADWKDVHWKVKETTAGIGEGTISIQVDPATGRVVGALEGPLGPATIDGLSVDGKMSATIARKEPTDQGFVGTMVGTVSHDHVEGTMYVSTGEASAIRTATFTTSPAGATIGPR